MATATGQIGTQKIEIDVTCIGEHPEMGRIPGTSWLSAHHVAVAINDWNRDTGSVE